VASTSPVDWRQHAMAIFKAFAAPSRAAGTRRMRQIDTGPRRCTMRRGRVTSRSMPEPLSDWRVPLNPKP